MKHPPDPADVKAVERAVMDDHNRPCLYGVAGPCQHPNCLEAHFNTLYALLNRWITDPEFYAPEWTQLRQDTNNVLTASNALTKP